MCFVYKVELKSLSRGTEFQLFDIDSDARLTKEGWLSKV